MRQFLGVLAALGVLVFVGAHCGEVHSAQDKKPDKQADKPHEVKAFRDIVYYDVPDDPERARHKLDVYRPSGAKKFPVLVLLHGGAWMIGSKDDYFGLYGYGTIARCLAERGLVVVIPNYRLSPAVRHPEHIKDVARAFAWTCKNVEKHGGDPRQIFVSGHSAGGHLAALLATDETYLKQEGRTRKDIRGVIGISGVYRVDDLELNLAAAAPDGTMRFNLNVRPLACAFGNDPKVLKQASPLTHVQPGLPPFLLLTGGLDYAPLKRMAREFAAALKDTECDVEEKQVAWRTHETLLFDIPNFTVDRTTTAAILEFIRRHARGGDECRALTQSAK